MKKITVLVLTLILPLVMAAGANALVVTVYTDKDAWSSACGDQFITETFTGQYSA